MNDTTQEIPAVSKLREAFDTARNAIIEGSELAKLVEELGQTVKGLQSEVSALARDVEYHRSRNRELDEQVTAVREARDRALAEASAQKDRADRSATERENQEWRLRNQADTLAALQVQLKEANGYREDAELQVMLLSDQLKAAEAKLAKIEEVFGKVEVKQEAPKPHYVDQPRDEVGKFQPTTYDRGSQSEGSGF